jgi:hypothetical protein
MAFSIRGMGASGVISSKTTNRAPPSVSASVRSFQQAQLRNDAVGDDEDLAVAKTGDGLAQAALEPGPTSRVGCGMGMKRVTRPAPFINALRPVARTESLIRSEIKDKEVSRSKGQKPPA